MFKKTITFTDYDGVERTEDYYFNLNKAELLELEMSEEGGYTAMIQKAVKEKDTVKVMKIFKDLILRSYGEKSPDGKRFIKNHELSQAFEQTEAYVVLFTELATDPNASEEFMTNVVPQMTEEQKAAAKKQLEEINK